MTDDSLYVRQNPPPQTFVDLRLLQHILTRQVSSHRRATSPTPLGKSPSRRIHFLKRIFTKAHTHKRNLRDCIDEKEIELLSRGEEID